MTMVLLELVSAAFALPLNAISAASLGWPFGQTMCAATALATATAGKIINI